MLKVAMLSCWHVHAKGYAKRVKANENAEVVAVWNEDVEVGQAWADDLGAKFYSDLDELLANPEIDAVICDAPTTMHHDVIIKAAKAGKHIHMEKPGGLDLAAFEELIATVKEKNLVFCVGYMYRWNPYIMELFAAIKAGELGDIPVTIYIDGDADDPDGYGFEGLAGTKMEYDYAALAVTAMVDGKIDYVIVDNAPAAAISKAINGK